MNHARHFQAVTRRPEGAGELGDESRGDRGSWSRIVFGVMGRTVDFIWGEES